jgi:hypothetical protein
MADAPIIKNWKILQIHIAICVDFLPPTPVPMVSIEEFHRSIKLSSITLG